MQAHVSAPTITQTHVSSNTSLHDSNAQYPFWSSWVNECWSCMYVCMYACIHVCMYVSLCMYYLRPRTEFRWSSVCQYHFGLAVKNCWIPVCGGARVQQNDRQSWIYKKKWNSFKRTGPIYKIWPCKRPFSEVFGISFLCAQKQILPWRRRLGVWWVDYIAHAWRPWYLPACCNKCVGARENRQNRQDAGCGVCARL